MTGASPRLVVTAPSGIGRIGEGDDLCAIVLESLAREGEALAAGDILVLAQKIVSKAEGRLVRLDSVTPSARADALAAETAKDPRVVELILRESREIVRTRPGLIIARHRLGYVLANAGIDASNVGAGRVLLLPEDPDRSCAEIRAGLGRRSGIAPGVIINDSLGRAWRLGTTGAALGVSGIAALKDMRGNPDMFGRPLQVSEIGLADEIAAAASIVMGQAAEARPVALVRGLACPPGDGRGADLIRPVELDLFD